MPRKYKIKELVTNVQDVAKFTDPYLSGPTGIVSDTDKTVWIANNGDGTDINRNVSHYDLYGVRRSENLPFIDYVSPEPLVPPSQQRQTLTDLFWLQKNVVYYRDGQIIPMPKFYDIPPIIGTPVKQPSEAELALNQFLNKPNGYLGTLVDLSYLVNFCVNYPLPLTTAGGKQATKLMSDAHNLIYKKLIIDLFNKDLIAQYGTKLSEAQRWLAIGANNVGPSIVPRGRDAFIKLVDQSLNIDFFRVETSPVVINNQLPIGLTYNTSRGFVGYEFNGARVSCDLIAATPKGVIYVYSPLIQRGLYYGFVTVLDNSDSYSVYTGITMISDYILITDLSNRRIEAFDFGWSAYRGFLFLDPSLPADYSPYNIFTYKDEIIVIYAKISLDSGPYLNQVLSGPGYGIINVFNLDGTLKLRAVTNGELNAPWGITVVKHHFAKGKFLIANHGDGRILVFDSKWNLEYKLTYNNYEKALAGLYGICSISDELYFTSGANGIVNGMFGKVIKSDKKKRHAHCDPRPAPPPRPCLRLGNNRR